MSRHFDPRLVNDPFGDPALYVQLVFERRALLFDLGDVSNLSPRQLLRISDVFVSHRHMDHFAGFDQLLRCLLGRETVVNFYGPPGLIDAVGHKLKAYSWNLIANYEENPVLRVTEVDENGQLRCARFLGRSAFEGSEALVIESIGSEDGVLLREPGFQVRATTLDHGIPVLAFALEERAHINIWRNKVESMGLVVGPWLGTFKKAIIEKRPEDTLIEVMWASRDNRQPQCLPLGELRKAIMRETAGRKIVYVVDCAFTDGNIKKIVSLAKDADILFIEAAFLDEDKARAADRRHLTARQAGTLGRLANAKRLVTFHHSPRYQGRGDALAYEAESAFGSEVVERPFISPLALKAPDH